MKLGNIYHICKNCVKGLSEFKLDSRKDSANNIIYSVTGMKKVISSINELHAIESLRESCNRCLSAIPTSYLDSDSFNISTNIWSSFNSCLNALKNKVLTIIDLYESMNIKKIDGESINIKLPDCSGYADFVKYNSDLRFVLEQSPYLRVEDGIIEFKCVDVGSIWLTFAVIGTTSTIVFKILENLVALVDHCIIVHSHYLTVQQQKELLQRQKTDTEKIQTTTMMLDELYKIQVKEVLDKLNDKLNYKFENGEDYERAKRSIETLGELISKGLEIRSELTNNDEIKKLFEPLEIKYINDKKTELITQSDSEE